MSEVRDIDVQAQAILRGLRELEALLNEPVAREALDLTKNAQTAQKHDVLQRLRRSLTQYLERDGDLYYVGLLGHFSSGKSSTINSILDTWSTEDARKVGLNPTDTTITLITRDSNVRALIGVIREGHVTIRSQAIDSPLLENVVLADTPGTGDPHLIAEIARDFLPMCDVILFLFSATSPLDQTDMPLLKELHQRLPFIPIRFVVTRADELRIDPSTPVSVDNIDTRKRTEFFNDVLSRINRLLEPTVYTEEHFILIDNKAHYNTDKLVELIKSKCDPTNPHSRILMHSHKLHYYLSAAKELKSFFAQFLDDKLRELNRIVEVAEQNIVRYNENVRISNSNLTKSWIDRLGTIRSLRETTIKRVPAPDRLPNDVSNFDTVSRKLAAISGELSKEANNAARYATVKIKQESLGETSHHLRESEKKNRVTAFHDLSTPRYRISTPTIKLEREFNSLIPSNLTYRWIQRREVETSALQEATRNLRKSAYDLTQLVQEKSPLVQCEAQVLNAQDSLSNDLREFFRNVELYRDGVFSHTTKGSISTLGIGAQLDALELEFAESDKAAFTADALKSLFPDFTEFSAKALTHLTELDQKLRPLAGKIRAFRISGPVLVQQPFEPILETEKSKLSSMIGAELQKDIDDLCSTLELRLSGVLVEMRQMYEIAIANAKKERFRRYVAIVILAGILSAGAYAAYHFLTERPTQSIFSVVGWSLVANFLGDAIGYMIARMVDHFPETSSKIRENFEIRFRGAVTEMTEEATRTHEFKAVNELNLGTELYQLYNRIIATDPDGWREKARDELKELKQVSGEYNTVWMEYNGIVDDVINRTSSYFSDATKNLELLNAVASRIKARAIEPSFVLLANTRQSLGEVKEKIYAVDFA